MVRSTPLRPSVRGKSSGAVQMQFMLVGAVRNDGVMERSEEPAADARALYPLSPSSVSAYGLRPGGAQQWLEEAALVSLAGRNSTSSGSPLPSVRRWISSPAAVGRPARLRSPFFSARSGASGADVGAIDAPGVPVDPAQFVELQTSTRGCGRRCRRAPSAKTVVDRLPRAERSGRSRQPAPVFNFQNIASSNSRWQRHCPPRPPFAAK